MAANLWSHPDKIWANVLNEARRLEWTIEEIKGHGWGRLWCPAHECTFRVDTTPRSSERKAKTARRSIQRCPHTVEDVAGRIRLGLQMIGYLLDAAENLIETAEALERQHQILEEVDLALKETERLLLAEEFDKQTQRESYLRANLDTIIADAGYIASDTEPVTILRTTDQEIRSARLALRGDLSPKHPEALVLRNQLDDCIARRQKLRILDERH